MRTIALAVCLASAPAWAGKAKGSLTCTTDGKVTLPAKDNRKLDKPIHCTVKLASGDADVGAIAIVVDGTESSAGNGELDGKAFSTDVTAPTCKSFTIVGRLHVEAGPVWEGKIDIKQVCPATAKKPAHDGTDWAEGQRETLTSDAADQIDSWITTYVFLDHAFFDMWPSGGVTIGKKSVGKSAAQAAADKAGGLYKLTGIEPADRWTAIVKSKTEIQIYVPGESGYGKFATAVFKLKGDRWVWTGTGSYDTGEP